MTGSARSRWHFRDGATVTPDGLRLDGKSGYAVSAPLPRELKAKTIEVWVRLDNLEQRGGGAISIQTPDGNLFDAIVFGEQEAGVWMAGSDSFAARAASEVRRKRKPSNRAVHVAISYAVDGMIRVFRDGRPYGAPYKSSGPVTFPAGESQVVFGLRHAPAGGNRMLAGTIVRARVYDRALDLAEVAASAATFGDHIDPAAITAALTPECRAERAQLMGEVEKLRSSVARQTRKAYAVSPREAGAMRVQIRGNPNQPGDLVAAGAVAAIVAPGADFRPAARRTRGPAARATGIVDFQPAKPALRAGRGQPSLAGPLRDGPGRDVQRSRVQRRRSLAPRAARLAGLRDGRARLEHQVDAQAHRHVGRLSTVVAAGRERARARRR